MLRRSKNEQENAATWDDVLNRIRSAGRRVGMFAKEAQIGKVADEWTAAYKETKAKSGFEDVDVGSAFSSLWGSKDDEEQVSRGLVALLALD